MGGYLIRISGLEKTYASGRITVPALRGISVDIQHGEYVAVMGPSGSGKSSLLNLLGCLDRPSAGDYRLDGIDVNCLSAGSMAEIRNDKIGFVFQNFNLLARATALENVQLPLLYRGLHRTERQRMAAAALTAVGLTARRDHLPSQLSGGEQQRVAIARAIVTDPALILADEPTGALDTKTGQEILALLDALNCAGRTILVVTHDPNVARHAHRILSIQDGALVADESDPAASKADAGQVQLPPSQARASTRRRRTGIRFWDGMRIALRALRANALRSSLTMLGVIIGVAAVIAMIAVGTGAQTQVAEQIRSLGANTIIVKPGALSRDGADRGAAKRTTLTQEDALAIAGELGDVEVAAPTITGEAQVVSGNRNWSTNVSGIVPDYLIARDWEITGGRPFTLNEIDTAAKVALVGDTVVRKLFDQIEPVGNVIRIKNVPFTVVGVLERKGSTIGGFDEDDVVYIPLLTARIRVLGGSDRANPRAVDFVMVKATAADVLDGVKQEIGKLLRQRHRPADDAADDFTVQTLASLLEARSQSSRTLTILLLAVASVSLVVGGISIMNIMLVSITERTREIGLRLAVGARPRDIRGQFLVELVTLSLLGGLAGIVVGIGAAGAIAAFAGWPILISSTSVLIAVCFSAAVGIFFGYYPALRASRLDPIVALRFE